MSFINRFTTTQKGAIVITGNTLGLSKSINLNSPGTSDSIGGFITTNTALPVPPAWAGIVNLANGENITLDWQQNSSSAFLNFPLGSTVIYAELIWGGLGRDFNIDLTSVIDNPIQFTTPLGTTSVDPDPATSFNVDPSTVETWYARSQNVTSLVAAAGVGKYTIGAVPAVLDPQNNTTNFAGWTLIVVYTNLSLPARNMTVFSGGELISSSSSVTTTVSGFIVPPTGTITARILTTSAEGDASRLGDFIQFGPDINSLTKLFGPNNPANPPNPVDNFFCSQINIGDPSNPNVGNIDLTGTFGTRNSNPFTATNISGGRQGWDITNVNGSSALVNGQTAATLRFATNSDVFLSTAFAIQIDTVAADLSIVKTDSPDPVIAGELLTYDLVIENLGPDNAQGVAVTDTLPSSIVSPEFSIDGGATFNPWVTPYFIGALDNGKSLAIKIRGTVATGTTSNISNTAVVVALTPDPNPNNNTSTAITTLNTSADLSIAKTVLTNPVIAGNPITYNISIKNAGPSDAQNVIVEDIVPPEILNPQFSIDGGATFNPWVSPYPIGTLVSGKSLDFIIRGVVNASTTSSITNTATVSSTTFDPNLDNNTSTVISDVTSSADVSIIKSSNPNPVVAGGLLTYTLSITNAGPSSAQNVILTDNIPSSLTSVEFSIDGGVTFNPWVSPYPIGTLGSGSSITVRIRGTVNPSQIQSISNTATVASSTPDPNPNNNTSTSITTVNTLADLEIIKTETPSPIIAGELLTYTILINNAGLSDAQNVTLTDNIDPNLTNVEFSIDGGITWNPWVSPYLIGTLPSGSSTTIRIRGKLSPSAIGSITNTAIVSSTTPDPDPSDNSSTIRTPIITSADISVTKEGSSNPILAGEVLTYTLVVSNAGLSDAQNVSLTDNIPNSLEGVEYSTDGGITWNPWVSPYSIGTLGNGNSVTILIRGTVKLSATGTITNTAIVSSTTPDPNPNNNTSTLITGINTLADISVLKTGSPDPVLSGGLLTYTIIVSNNGPNDAQDVSLSDSVPGTLSSVEFSIDGGITWNPWVTPYSIGTLANGSSESILIRGTVAPGATGIITNTAIVSSTTPDPNPDNNTSTEITAINELADISIIKEGNPSPVIAGELLTYTLVVSNAGPNDAENVVLTDNIPAALDSVEFSIDGGITFNPWLNNYNLGTLGSGDSQNILIRGTVKTGVTEAINNTAVVTSSTPDDNPDNNTSTINTPVTTLADISVKKVSTENPTIPGNLLVYDIEVANVGPSDSQNVVLSDVTPPQLLNPEFSIDGGTTFNPWTSPYSLGTLIAGDLQTIKIRGTVSPNATNLIVNTASVNSTTTDPNIDNNISTAITNVDDSADLSVLKNVMPTNLNAGENLMYSIVVLNSGPASAADVTLVDTIPSSVLNPEFSIDGGSTFNPWISPYIIGTLPNNGSETILIRGTTASSTTDNISNTSVVSSPTPDPNPDNNTSTAVATVSTLADILVIKTASENPILPGDTLIYDIVISNIGPSDSKNVVLTDAVPNLLLNQEFSTDGGITFNPWVSPYLVGTVPNSTSVTIKIRGTLNTNATGTLNNTAIVSASTTDPNPNNNTSTNTTNILKPSISLIKSSNRTSSFVGDTIRYFISVNNNGEVDLINVLVSDILNPNLTYSGNLTINGVPSSQSIITGVTLPTLPIGTAIIIAFNANVNSIPLYRTIDNTSRASYEYVTNNGPVSGEGISNTVEVTIYNPNLDLIKTVDKQYVAVGDIVTYTIVAINVGDVTLGNVFGQPVTVFDTLPPELLCIRGSVTIDGVPDPTACIIAGVNIGTLKVSEFKVITFKAEVIASSVTPVENIANATFGYQLPDRGPETGTSTSNISLLFIDVANIDIVKTASTECAYLEDLITYTVLLTNNGTLEAMNVIFKDNLPEGVVLLNRSFSVNGTIINNADLSVGVYIGNIPVNTTVTIKYTVRVVKLNPEMKLINSATVQFEYVFPDGTIDTVTSNPATTTVNLGMYFYKELIIEKQLKFPCEMPCVDKIHSVTADAKILKYDISTISEPGCYDSDVHILSIMGLIKAIVKFESFGKCDYIYSKCYDIPFKTTITLPDDYPKCDNVEIKAIVKNICFNRCPCNKLNVTIVIEIYVEFPCCKE